MGELTNPQDIIKAQIEGMVKRTTQPTGGKIRNIGVKLSKEFVIPTDDGDEHRVRGPIEVVVLDFINNNQFYKKSYDAGDDDPPDCWAQAWNLEDMAPDPKLVKEPVHPQCEGCPMNEYGSAEKGTGKACKNRRKVALKLVGDDENLYIISVSPSGTTKFDKLMNELAAARTPMSQVVMEMKFDEKRDYPVVIFTPKEMNEKFESHVAELPNVKRVLESKPKEVEEAA